MAVISSELNNGLLKSGFSIPIFLILFIVASSKAVESSLKEKIFLGIAGLLFIPILFIGLLIVLFAFNFRP
jgi:hypothetical protein